MTALARSAAAPFAGVPPEAAALARLWGYAAALALDAWMDGLGAEGEALRRRFGFLDFYRREAERIAPGLPPAHWPRRLAAWEPADAPLARAAARLGLSAASRLVLALALLPEEDGRFGALFEALQGPLPLSGPSVEIAGRILGGGAAEGRAAAGPLIEAGLLEASGDGPGAQRALGAPAPVRDAVAGLPPDAASGLHLAPAAAARRLDALAHPPDFLARLAALAPLLAAGEAPTVLLRAGPGCDAEEVAAALARASGRGLLLFGEAAVVDAAAIRRACAVGLLAEAAVFLRREAAPGETLALPPAPRGAPPLFVALGRDGGLGPSRAAAALSLRLPFPSPALRERVWREALGERAPEDLATLRDRVQAGAGHIRRLAAGALGEASLDGRARVEARDVRSAARRLGRHALDALADPVEARGDWADLIAPPSTIAALRDLADRIRWRERALDLLAETAGRGVRALFKGPSGAGKTLAARVVANAVGMDLYRVDLAAAVSKYVGETEKNLSRLFDRAEALDVVLLIDEGDALMAQRTEVRNANDRFANLETNFLLQRLERYDGVVIVTTNLPDSVDPAFQRRMDVVAPFTRPSAPERRMIWSAHLPPETALGEAALDRLAARHALTGGQIRGAVRAAAARALAEGGLVDETRLLDGVAEERRKSGAAPPAFGLAADPAPAAPRRLSAFAGALAARGRTS